MTHVANGTIHSHVFAKDTSFRGRPGRPGGRFRGHTSTCGVLAVALLLESLLLIDALGPLLPTTGTLACLYGSPSPTVKAEACCIG